MDIRDQRGRAVRLASSFLIAVAVGAICSVIATHLPAGPYDRPVAREWFELATGIFGWLICFLSTLALQDTRARQQWQLARAKLYG